MNLHKPLIEEQHRQIRQLLPWYVNGSLQGHERQLVEAHLRSCFLCGKELLELRNLSRAVNGASDLDVAAEVSFANLRIKMHGKPMAGKVSAMDEYQPIAPGWAWLAAHRVKWLASPGAMAVKHLAIAASLLLALIPLTLHLWKPITAGDYFTLAANKPVDSGHGLLHVVFAKSTSDADVDALLAQVNGRRMDGPNSVGAYTVQLDDSEESRDPARIIEFLRRQQLVLLVEPAIQR